MYEFGALKRRIAAGDPVLGTFCFLPSVESAEIAGLAGLDFLVIDMEHAAKDRQVVENMIRAAQLGGASALVRVTRNDPSEILHVLEAGADGIVVPFVRTTEDVARADRASRFPPRGNRGTCGLTRFSRYGLDLNDFTETIAQANAGTVVIGQVEDRVGMDNFGDLLDCEPGLDAVLIGRGDLSTDLGFAGRSNGPEVTSVVEDMHALRKPQHPALGMFVFSQREVDQWAAHGSTLFVMGTDTGVLSRAHLKARARFDAAALTASSSAASTEKKEN